MKKSFTILITAILFMAMGCSKDNAKPELKYTINTEKVTTKHGEDFKFTVNKGNENIDNSEIVWSSSDENIGKISDIGVFTARMIGSTTITAKIGTVSVLSEVIVETHGQLFAEPVLSYGASKGTIKSEEKRTLLNEVEGAILYKGENSLVKNVMYTFKDNKMESAALIFNTLSVSGTDLAIFYLERYELIGTEDGISYLKDKKGTYVMLGFVLSNEFTALYAKLDPELNMSIKSLKDRIMSTQNKGIKILN